MGFSRLPCVSVLAHPPLPPPEECRRWSILQFLPLHLFQTGSDPQVPSLEDILQRTALPLFNLCWELTAVMSFPADVVADAETAFQLVDPHVPVIMNELLDFHKRLR